MLVKELIEKLKELDGDFNVEVESFGFLEPAEEIVLKETFKYNVKLDSLVCTKENSYIIR